MWKEMFIISVVQGAFLEKIKSENPETPCFLFGHSTGGAVVLKVSQFKRLAYPSFNMIAVFDFQIPELQFYTGLIEPSHRTNGERNYTYFTGSAC